VAVKFLKTRELKEIGVLDFSMGGAVGLMATPDIPAVKAVVSDSSYARLSIMVPAICRP